MFRSFDIIDVYMHYKVKIVNIDFKIIFLLGAKPETQGIR